MTKQKMKEVQKERAKVVVEKTPQEKAMLNLRDDHNGRLVMKYSELRRKEKMMIKRIENSQKQLEKIAIAKRIYEREERRFKKEFYNAKLQAGIVLVFDQSGKKIGER